MKWPSESDGTVVLWTRTTRGTRVATGPVLYLDGQAFAALAEFVNQEEGPTMSDPYDVIVGANVHLAAEVAEPTARTADGRVFLSVGRSCFTAVFSGTPAEVEMLARRMLAAVDAAVDAAEVAS
jgi:hypothetical protein